MERGVFLGVSHAPITKAAESQRPQIFLWPPTNAHISWPATKFGMITHVGKGVFLGGQARSHAKGPTFPFFQISYIYLRAHGTRNSNQFLHCDQTYRLEEKSYWVDHAPCPGHFFVTRMLTRDLFAVANVLVKLSSLVHLLLLIKLCTYSTKPYWRQAPPNNIFGGAHYSVLWWGALHMHILLT